jgi:4-hydroxymandelate oxidase
MSNRGQVSAPDGSADMNRRRMLLSTGALLGAMAPGLNVASAAAPTVAGAKPSRALSRLVALSDYEEAARKRIAHMAYEYVASGAADERTMRWNREAFDEVRLRPRALVDVEQVDTRVTLFGEVLPHPVLLAPTAFHRLVHPDGEVATARGAGQAQATFVVSSLSTRRLGEIAGAASGPLWFQFFAVRRDNAAFIRDTVQEAEGVGCRALVVTVDVPVAGARNRVERANFRVPDGFETPYFPSRNQVRQQAGQPITGSCTWEDFAWFRSLTRLPVLLKGVLNPDDAEQAVRAGAAGVIVSNHGGRSLDTLPASLSALPQVVERVAGRVPVLLDGGIRRGTDVLKALALGARAVLIGRPYLYGLGVAGAEGVAQVVNILRRELEMALALTGRPSVAGLDSSVIWR